MPRLGRYFLADQPLHVIQRGDNRSAVFFCDDDYRRYRGWLGEAAAEYGLSIHAYVLMTNHVRLLVTPAKPESLPRTMQSLGRRRTGDQAGGDADISAALKVAPGIGADFARWGVR